MRDNARRYDLTICNIISYGVGTSGSTCHCSILDNFCVEKYVGIQEEEPSPYYDYYYGYIYPEGKAPPISAISAVGIQNLGNGYIIRDYPEITTIQLSQMDKPDFDNRVCDYLNYLKIGSKQLRDDLIETSSFYDPEGDVFCKLNPDFTVYKFLDGVRIVNIGKVNGIAQYRAYPVGDDPELYNWETNPTILSIDLNLVYIFEVRDYVDGEEFCRVGRTISLPTLVPSTTELPPDILVYLNQCAAGCYHPTEYKCGSISLSKTLEVGQAVGIEFLIGAESSGAGLSCVDLCCKKCGNTTATKFCSVSNVGASPLTGSFIVCAGDVITYSLTNVVSQCGDCACSCLELQNVNGFGTTSPTIDVGRCFTSIENTTSREFVYVYVQRCCETSTSKNGEIKFTPAIPVGQYIDLDFNTLACACLAGTSAVELSCKANGGSTFTQIFNNTNLNPQPSTASYRVNYGDRLCYSVIASACLPASWGTSQFRITNAVGSNGVSTQVGFGYDYYCGTGLPIGLGNITTSADDEYLGFSGDSIAICVASTPVTISVCNQNSSSSATCCSKNGFINIAPALLSTQCLTVGVCGYAGYNNGNSCVTIYCKPNGSCGYTKVFGFDGVDFTSPSLNRSCSFIARNGDCFCYSMCGIAIDGGTSAEACFRLCSAIGVGATPSISSTKCGSFVSIVQPSPTTTVAPTTTTTTTSTTTTTTAPTTTVAP